MTENKHHFYLSYHIGQGKTQPAWPMRATEPFVEIES